ncbi:hypothetical protein Bpfe_023928 [Biomphalaria pfeifferi]|uniref:Uncharacterized protein n=1 Tax=Biomphalaria pfeifferi TaxID=112525 RepID=A0AAD8B292_BIOPF|nr:hypothetical protein Bpfe_023928 [Biomphalaria pfeifferi]
MSFSCDDRFAALQLPVDNFAFGVLSLSGKCLHFAFGALSLLENRGVLSLSGNGLRFAFGVLSLSGKCLHFAFGALSLSENRGVLSLSGSYLRFGCFILQTMAQCLTFRQFLNVMAYVVPLLAFLAWVAWKNCIMGRFVTCAFHTHDIILIWNTHTSITDFLSRTPAPVSGRPDQGSQRHIGAVSNRGFNKGVLSGAFSVVHAMLPAAAMTTTRVTPSASSSTASSVGSSSFAIIV